ncbi:Phage integrase family protein [compost metagenome]
MDPIDRFLAEQFSQSLPGTVTTRGGSKFSPNESKWKFREATTLVSLNFGLLPNDFAPFILGFKKTLIWYFQNRSPYTSIRNFNAFSRFARWLADNNQLTPNEITIDNIINFKNSHETAEYCLASLRAFLNKWIKLNAYGIEQSVSETLNKLKFKEYPTGVAVATLDPNKGPLTDFEFEAAQAILNNAYKNNEVSFDELLLCHLIIALGARPIQLASLKCKDLTPPNSSEGDYLLLVPRAKQHLQLDRTEFKMRKLTKQIGSPLSAYAATIRAEFAELLDDPDDAPLFPQRLGNPGDTPGFMYHHTSSGLAQRIINIFRPLQVPSDRLRVPTPVNARRLRRTFATRAAEEGWPLVILAELMDHSSIRHVEIYAGLTTRIRAAFSRKIAMDMAPLAMVFTGKVITSETEATRPGPKSRIIDLRVDRNGASMGSCGSHAHCGFARPTACYGGCYSFEPWLDGPHEEALDYMLARREYLIKNADARIASINDRAILGCAQIIIRCRDILKENNK